MPLTHLLAACHFSLRMTSVAPPHQSIPALTEGPNDLPATSQEMVLVLILHDFSNFSWHNILPVFFLN